MKKTEKVKIIVNSFTNYFLEGDWSMLDSISLPHLVKNADYNTLSPSIISENENVYKAVEWNRVDRMTVLRIVSRNTDIANYVNIKQFNFSIEEASYFLRANPDLINKLDIDYENLTKADAVSLLKLGQVKFAHKINPKLFTFTAKETFEIFLNHAFNKEIFEIVDAEVLDSYYISEVIKYTAGIFLNKLTVDKIAPKHWVDILTKHPDLLPYCKLEKFKESDIFYTVLLLKIFNELIYLITERKNYKEDLSLLGWEKLIIIYPNEFINESPRHMFNETTWKHVISARPELAAYKL